MTREEAEKEIRFVFKETYANEIIKALEQEPNIDELRVEITALQNRCYALTKGVMCGFCNYECQYKVDRSGE